MSDGLGEVCLCGCEKENVCVNVCASLCVCVCVFMCSWEGVQIINSFYSNTFTTVVATRQQIKSCLFGVCAGVCVKEKGESKKFSFTSGGCVSLCRGTCRVKTAPRCTGGRWREKCNCDIWWLEYTSVQHLLCGLDSDCVVCVWLIGTFHKCTYFQLTCNA